jgi:putative phosphoesterase
MKIGLISDTHDNLPMVEKAVARLNTEKVELVLHAGDYNSPFVIPKFKVLNCKLVGVFGNNDGDHEFLKKRFSETPNCEIHNNFAAVNVGEFKIALLHGDDHELLDALINSGGFDAVVSGHTHNAASSVKGKTLVLCPGEVCAYLSGKATLMLLDTATRQVSLIEL